MASRSSLLISCFSLLSSLLLSLLLLFLLTGCAHRGGENGRYLFFLHNRFLEEAGADGVHSEHGRAEYREIVEAFREGGFTVITELRPKGTDMKEYAPKVVRQIDSLIATGVDPSRITVVGTSKGGYIAKYVSSLLQKKEVRFVLVGCCNPEDTVDFPEVKICGTILSIYERGDTMGGSCNDQQRYSPSPIPRYVERELHSGVKHGFLYKGLSEWIDPAIDWGYGRHDSTGGAGEERGWRSLPQQIDALLGSAREYPFNGIILIAQGGRTTFVRGRGFADTAGRTPLALNSRFVVGSISKQITAVLVLRELDSGRLALDAPIRRYIPELTQPWADSITVHHLLTHTHGLRSFDSAPAFSPGSRFEYSQIGYALLAGIVERTSGRSFVQLSDSLFSRCGMTSTLHPVPGRNETDLVTGMVQRRDNTWGSVPLERSLENPVAAGGFISTASDLARWNTLLHTGQLLSGRSYELMMRKYAVRQHPMFGPTDYGYGITITDSGGMLQLGQTGYAPGFASMSYYYPATGTSVVVLQNLVPDLNDPPRAFGYHLEVLRIVREVVGEE